MIDTVTAQPGSRYKLRDGLVIYKTRTVVPRAQEPRRKLLAEFHDSKLAGHSGVLRAYKRLAHQFYWPSMYKHVQDHVSACEICQRTKTGSLAPAGLLQPLPIPCQVWDDITLDFIEGLPRSHGKDTIFVVVGRLSKSAHFTSLSLPFTAKVVAEHFVEGVVKLHGMPQSVISDRDPVFISKFWQEFFTMSGTKLMLSSAYHPQTEVVHRCLEQYLRCFAHQWPRKRTECLPWAELWYNTTYHISTGMTPFQALYGRLPPVIPHYQAGQSPVQEVDKHSTHRDELLIQQKSNLAIARNRMKQVADKKRREADLQVGDMVLLRLHPYRQQTVFRRAHPKLASRYFGPYPTTQRIGQVAYKLQLPEGSRIHPVFHVSLLKKFIGDAHTSCLDLPPVADDGAFLLDPQRS